MNKHNKVYNHNAGTLAAQLKISKKRIESIIKDIETAELELTEIISKHAGKKMPSSIIIEFYEGWIKKMDKTIIEYRT